MSDNWHLVEKGGGGIYSVLKRLLKAVWGVGEYGLGLVNKGFSFAGN